MESFGIDLDKLLNDFEEQEDNESSLLKEHNLNHCNQDLHSINDYKIVRSNQYDQYNIDEKLNVEVNKLSNGYVKYDYNVEPLLTSNKCHIKISNGVDTSIPNIYLNDTKDNSSNFIDVENSLDQPLSNTNVPFNDDNKIPVYTNGSYIRNSNISIENLEEDNELARYIDVDNDSLASSPLMPDIIPTPEDEEYLGPSNLFTDSETKPLDILIGHFPESTENCKSESSQDFAMEDTCNFSIENVKMNVQKNSIYMHIINDEITILFDRSTHLDLVHDINTNEIEIEDFNLIKSESSFIKPDIASFLPNDCLSGSSNYSEFNTVSEYQPDLTNIKKNIEELKNECFLEPDIMKNILEDQKILGILPDNIIFNDIDIAYEKGIKPDVTDVNVKKIKDISYTSNDSFNEIRIKKNIPDITSSNYNQDNLNTDINNKIVNTINENCVNNLNISDNQNIYIIENMRLKNDSFHSPDVTMCEKDNSYVVPLAIAPDITNCNSINVRNCLNHLNLENKENIINTNDLLPFNNKNMPDVASNTNGQPDNQHSIESASIFTISESNIDDAIVQENIDDNCCFINCQVSKICVPSKVNEVDIIVSHIDQGVPDLTNFITKPELENVKDAESIGSVPLNNNLLLKSSKSNEISSNEIINSISEKSMDLPDNSVYMKCEEFITNNICHSQTYNIESPMNSVPFQTESNQEINKLNCCLEDEDADDATLQMLQAEAAAFAQEIHKWEKEGRKLNEELESICESALTDVKRKTISNDNLFNKEKLNEISLSNNSLQNTDSYTSKNENLITDSFAICANTDFKKLIETGLLNSNEMNFESKKINVHDPEIVIYKSNSKFVALDNQISNDFNEILVNDITKLKVDSKVENTSSYIKDNKNIALEMNKTDFKNICIEEVNDDRWGYKDQSDGQSKLDTAENFMETFEPVLYQLNFDNLENIDLKLDESEGLAINHSNEYESTVLEKIVEDVINMNNDECIENLDNGQKANEQISNFNTSIDSFDSNEVVNGAMACDPTITTGIQIGQAAPIWIPDSESNFCNSCQLPFTWMRRRHHCRGCGQIFCNNCCNAKVSLQYLNGKKERVCDNCFEIISNDELSRDYDSNFQIFVPTPNQPLPPGVLKKQNSSSPTESKHVMFSDGVKPGGELAAVLDSTDGYQHSRHLRKSKKQTSKKANASRVNRTNNDSTPIPTTLFRETIPPIASLIPSTNDYIIQYNVHSDVLLEKMLDEKQEPVIFVIHQLLTVKVKIVKMDCCMNKSYWCFISDGLSVMGQKELVYLIEYHETEFNLPIDILHHIVQIYQNSANGEYIEHLDFSVLPNGSFGVDRFSGFLYISPSFQCLEKLPLPSYQPLLFGLLIFDIELTWARAFPIRLMFRLGAELRYYPCPIVSSRERACVYEESLGHTVMNLLVDFQNFRYSLGRVRGLLIHIEENKTTVLVPKSMKNEVFKLVSNSDNHVMSMGGCFSKSADSHLVCLQLPDKSYQTQAINIQGRPRKITGASFVIFNGSLKSSSGCKSSIVEDGLMIQIAMDKLTSLKAALLSGEDFEIGVATEEIVYIKWVDMEAPVIYGLKSPVDGLQLEIYPCRKLPQRHYATSSYSNSNPLLIFSQFFVLSSPYGISDEPTSDPSLLKLITDYLASSFTLAVQTNIHLLPTSSSKRIALRITLALDQMCYETGIDGTPLPQLCLENIDNLLIPAIHSSGFNISGNSALILELHFHFLYPLIINNSST